MNSKNKVFFGLIALTLLSVIIISYSFLTIPSLNKLDGCFTAEMNKNEVCSNSSNYVKLSNISENLINAIVVSEDGNYWGHSGVDWFEIKESFRINLEKGKLARGGSTITQQLIKNVFFSSEKSFVRKFKEAYLAIEVEKKMSKRKILEIYLNTIEFGENLYGIKGASEYYFSKQPSQINILEASFLAFLLPNPKVYSDSYHKEQLTPFAKKMMQLILNRMVFYKKITEINYQSALENIDRFPFYSFINFDSTLNEPEDLELSEDEIFNQLQEALDQSNESN